VNCDLFGATPDAVNPNRKEYFSGSIVVQRRQPKAIDQVLGRCRRASLFGDSDAIEVNQRDAFGDTPLHLVCRWNDSAAVSLLIEAGADVNAIGERGQTPLFATASPQVARLLIDAGADVRITDVDNHTAEQYARLVGRSQLADFIASTKKGRDKKKASVIKQAFGQAKEHQSADGTDSGNMPVGHIDSADRRSS